MTTMEATGPYGQAHSGFKPPRGRGREREVGFSMRGRVVLGIVFAVLLLGGIGGWAVTAKLSSAVIGVGSVLVDEDLKVVQHLDGGVVSEIAVREGDTVTAGQALLRLEDIQIRTERDILRGQLAELMARQARLIAQRDGAQSLSFPNDFLTTFADAQFIAQGEQQLFQGHLRYLQSQEEQLRLQIGQLREEIHGIEFQQTALEAELALVLEDHARVKTLSESGLIESSRLSELNREIARMQGQTGELEAALARAQSRISEIELQINALHQSARTDAQRELRGVEASLAETEERLTAAENRLARTEIRAPVSGVINELNVTTLGGVISPAEHLMTIVPEGADLTIEFRIATNDIDQIAVGQAATLRFSAFNQRTTPEVDGVITRVSAAAQHDRQTGESYYLAQVEATGDASFLGSRGLVPGMPVEVFVQTDEQTAIAYFMQPFTDQITRAFREE